MESMGNESPVWSVQVAGNLPLNVILLWGGWSLPSALSFILIGYVDIFIGGVIY